MVERRDSLPGRRARQFSPREFKLGGRAITHTHTPQPNQSSILNVLFSTSEKPVIRVMQASHFRTRLLSAICLTLLAAAEIVCATEYQQRAAFVYLVPRK